MPSLKNLLQELDYKEFRMFAMACIDQQNEIEKRKQMKIREKKRKAYLKEQKRRLKRGEVPTMFVEDELQDFTETSISGPSGPTPYEDDGGNNQQMTWGAPSSDCIIL